VKVGLQISSFTWPGGTAAIAPTLARIVRDADDMGFDSIWVMDHFFQIRGVGKVEEPMLEGMTTLGFMAAHSSRARLGLMVGGGGERKTLRLVAQYADACNVFGSPENVARKYAILDAHCRDVGRDPREIERSTLQNVRVGPAGAGRTESPQEVIDRFGELSDAGVEHVIFELKDAHVDDYRSIVGRDIIPALHALP
jgi:alkanesulfonate monooxygenase SsuD/methylene tetrahydromethanopterin reductase-like flavin-dependent oxidoreductase (luciferase family)